MKKIHILPAALLGIISCTVSAQTLWDGDSSAFLQNPNNWNNNTAPGTTSDPTIDVTTGLINGNQNRLSAGQAFNHRDWTIDLAAWRVQGEGLNALIDSYGDITFTSTFTGSPGNLTFGATSDVLRMRNRVPSMSFVNNGSGDITFGGTAGSVNLQGTGAGDTTSFAGTGNFQFLSNSGVGSNGLLDRFWLQTSGTTTVNIGANSNAIAPILDVRVLDGSLVLSDNEQIADTVDFTLAGTGGLLGAQVTATGITETMGDLAALTDGGTIFVDGITDFTFDDFRNVSTINIDGWVETSSSIVFADLTSSGVLGYQGTVADGALIDGLTLDGGSAYFDDIGGGSFAVSAVPEPSLYSTIVVVFVLAAYTNSRRKRKV